MGLLGRAILNEGRDPTGTHVLNLKFMHKPAENRECNKTIHMSSMSEERFTLCHKLLPVIQIKLQCLLCSMQLRGYLLAPGGKLQH